MEKNSLNKDLIDFTYDAISNYLEQNKSISTLTLQTIIDEVRKYLNDKNLDINLGSFYVDLLQDNRFVFLGNDQWTLTNHITNDSYKKNQDSLYNYNMNPSLLEEQYDEDALPSEMVNAKNEVYDEDENEISRDSFNDKSEYDDEDENGDELDLGESSDDEEINDNDK